ncbi:MAG: hypothetical protein NZ480_05850 [Bdellovibrionaceae bacterium]|nr:hypothetical protein [Pseudobdellovibrionaceae bacterium]MDW8190390.1 hypothetical protein [Pseudobdellovibrionaceae bacterium]
MGILYCYHCGNSNTFSDRVGFRDTCERCGQDLHSCVHCVHFDRNASKECREPNVEYVREKERSNYCDYFAPKVDSIQQGQRPKSREELWAAAEALFKKGKSNN